MKFIDQKFLKTYLYNPKLSPQITALPVVANEFVTEGFQKASDSFWLQLLLSHELSVDYRMSSKRVQKPESTNASWNSMLFP